MAQAWKPQGTFDHYWFRDFGRKLFERYLLPRAASISSYLEVGVAEGQSMLWALEHLGKPDGLFVGIDPYWDGRRWHVGEGKEHLHRTLDNLSTWYDGRRPVEFTNGLFMWNADEQLKAKPVCQINAVSSQSFLKTESRNFDACYIDGSHNADDALFDIISCFRLLNNNGVMIVDDLDRKLSAGRPQVFQAVEAFKMAFEGWFDVLFWHQRAIGFIKRTRRRRRGYPPILEQGPNIDPSGPTGD
jgi:hypothetical protein